MSESRINDQPDLILTIVQVPEDWRGESIYDVPVESAVLSQVPVASFDEAHDDLVRWNRLAMKSGLRQWAVIQMPPDECSG